MFWLAVLSSLPALIAGECVVESHQCDFPFQVEGETYYGCMEGEQGADRYYCKTQLGEKYVTGVCNGGCFEDDGSPAIFNASVGDEVKALFCKTYGSPCKFPFIWEDREYRECTTDGNSPFPWCAIEVDDQGNLVDKRWGKCDMSSCDPVSAKSEAAVHGSKAVRVNFSEYSGTLVFEQSSPDEQMTVTGSLEGLPDTDLLLAVVQGNCDEPLENIIESIVTVQSLQTGTVDSKLWSLSLYPGDKLVLGWSAIIKEQDTALLNEEGGLQQGQVLACAPIIESTEFFSLTIIIIIILVAVIVLLLLVLLCICCCCCYRRRRSKRSPEKSERCSIDESYGTGDIKLPLYDELSIPFIDASLPPTPKIGRSTDQLAILLGRRSSKTSLSNLEE